MRTWLTILAVLCVAAAPAQKPRTRPTSAPTAQDLAKAIADAQAKVNDARAVVGRARTDAAKRWEAGAGKVLIAGVAAKQKALEEARRTGTAQEKLDASSSYTKAKAVADKARTSAVESDIAVKAAGERLTREELSLGNIRLELSRQEDEERHLAKEKEAAKEAAKQRDPNYRAIMRGEIVAGMTLEQAEEAVKHQNRMYDFGRQTSSYLRGDKRIERITWECGSIYEYFNRVIIENGVVVSVN